VALAATVSSLVLEPGSLQRPSAASVAGLAVVSLLPEYLRPAATLSFDALPPTTALNLSGGGTVAGDLIFKGGGDPVLTSERIYLLAHELKARGVLRVTGRIRLDQSAFDGQRFGNGWERTSANTTPPILPLSVNFNRDNGRLVADPDRQAVEILTRILTEAGISIQGDGQGGTGRGSGRARSLML